MPVFNFLLPISRKTAKLPFFCNFLFAAIFGVNDPLLSLKCAERLFNEEMFLDALPFYEQVKFSGLGSEEELRDQLLFRLAACHLNQNDPQSAHHYLYLLNLEKLASRNHAYHFYLLGLTLDKLGDKTGALSFFHQCIPNTHHLFHSNLLALEKGYRLFQMGKLDQAIKELELIKQPFVNLGTLPTNPLSNREFSQEVECQKIFNLGQLNLIKIFLSKNESASAKLILDDLQLTMNRSDPLYAEFLYLEGVLFFLQGEENKAIECFEDLLSHIPPSHPNRSPYLLQSIFIGYLKQLSRQDQPLSTLYAILLKAKNAYLELLSSKGPQHSQLYEKKEIILAELSAQLSKYKAFLHIQSKEWTLAEEELNQLILSHPPCNMESEAWFWRGYCAEINGDTPSKFTYYQKAYALDPEGPIAPIAYFRSYLYIDYLNGQKKSIKHLQAMPSLFPNHPLLISAYHLIGLYHKKDHLSPEGITIRSKDLTAACEAFESAESTFCNLMENGSIPNQELSYFLQVSNHAQLEKGKTYFLIAQSSKEGKKHIYLKYAARILTKLIDRFEQQQVKYSITWAEAEFRLFQVFEEMGSLNDQKEILDRMLAHFQQADITQGYWLSKTWFEKGKLAKQAGDFSLALNHFKESEKSSYDKTTLSPDEKLELLIQQSLCHKELNQLEEAMRLLSQVINENVISSLRIKAMFLRAEIYELQGRPELALKQLESTSRKGGEWAQKARKKIDFFQRES